MVDMDRSLLFSLIAFLLFFVLENILSTVVGPSLIFYIESVGGTKDDYGLTTSSVCLGMTPMVFFFGRWVDSNGNKYRAPLTFAFSLGIMGSIIYFLASVLPKGFWAVNAILLGRFITGMGGGGKTLCKSWIATAIPFEKQKSVYTILNMVGIVGQTVGPLMNTLVAEINTSIPITSTYSIQINPYNSIGLLVALNEVLLMVIFALFLKEPPSQKEKALASSTDATKAAEAGLRDILNALSNFDICFPLIQRFVAMACMAMSGVAMAPVAANMLGWTPVDLSALSVVISGVSFLAMGVTLFLAMRNTSDFTMIFVGNVIFMISGLLCFFLWRMDTASALTYSLPHLLITFAYPFAGPANQSSFNKAVFSRPELASSIGVLQSIYTQAATIAGIVIPPFVTYFVLNDPKDVNLDSPYELSLWALYVPISSALMIIGLLYEEFVLGKNELGLLKSQPTEAAEDEVSPDETSKLLATKRNKSTRRSIVEINQVFTRQYEVNRRMSSEFFINGIGIINPVETTYDTELMKELSSGKEEWEHLFKLDEEMDEMEMKE
ncbi:hypothetical protein ACHAXM_003066 [Skeletonema potamos]